MAQLLTSRYARLIAVLVLSLGLGGCTGVAFYEKQALANPVMKFEADASEIHFRQKVQYSREAAIGGIGDTAGGGCGCY